MLNTNESELRQWSTAERYENERYKYERYKHECYEHERFVVGANLLNVQVELGVYKRFCRRVAVGDSDDTDDILEVVVVVHLHLKRRIQLVVDDTVTARNKLNTYLFEIAFAF